MKMLSKLLFNYRQYKSIQVTTEFKHPQINSYTNYTLLSFNTIHTHTEKCVYFTSYVFLLSNPKLKRANRLVHPLPSLASFKNCSDWYTIPTLTNPVSRNKGCNLHFTTLHPSLRGGGGGENRNLQTTN